MKVSKEVTDLILNNIDKDILNLSFLRELRDYLAKYNDLGAYLKDIDFDYNGKNAIYFNNKIHINKNDVMLWPDEAFRALGIEENKIIRNSIYLHTFLHEIEHANQEKTAFESVLNGSSLYSDLIMDGWDAHRGANSKYEIESNFFSRIYGKYLYRRYHDIFPHEFSANALSGLYIFDISKDFNNLDKENLSWLKYIITIYSTRGYRLVNNKIVSPLSRFYEIAKLGYDESDYDISSLSLKEKFQYGFVDDENEIYEVFKGIREEDSPEEFEMFIDFFKETARR